MRLTAENKAKIRHRILSGAADLFRSKGVESVNIDQIMSSAGLTRGAFYAHFDSKGALFAEVMRREHPLIRMLATRDDETAEELWQQALAIFHDYLAPEYLTRIHAGCSFAALTGDAARADADVKEGFRLAWAEALCELARGQTSIDPHTLQAALVLATGAVTAAAAMDDAAAGAAVLLDARHAFDSLMAQARGGSG